MAKTATDGLFTVVLLKPHTDSGIDYQAGDSISVDAVTKQWLLDNSIIAADAAGA
jgi:hypothetical protein